MRSGIVNTKSGLWKTSHQVHSHLSDPMPRKPPVSKFLFCVFHFLNNHWICIEHPLRSVKLLSKDIEMLEAECTNRSSQEVDNLVEETGRKEETRKSDRPKEGDQQNTTKKARMTKTEMKTMDLQNRTNCSASVPRTRWRDHSRLNSVVYHGAIPVLCSKLIEISFIDLASKLSA